eukprot:1097295-Rhodomonas_salina.1
MYPSSPAECPFPFRWAEPGGRPELESTTLPMKGGRPGPSPRLPVLQVCNSSFCAAFTVTILTQPTALPPWAGPMAGIYYADTLRETSASACSRASGLRASPDATRLSA